MKRLFAFVITLALLLSMMSASALGVFAVPETEPAKTCTDAQGVSYELSEDGTYYIVTAFAQTKLNVEIPAEINGIPVKELGYACFQQTQLESIKLPETITYIGRYAFFCCDYLMAVIIPESVVEIGDSAFYMCRSLTIINIPASVKTIGTRVFGGCTDLQTITVDDGNTVYYDDNNCLIEIETKRLMAGCKNNAIPNDVLIIAYGAYSNYDDMTSFVLPDSITTLEHNAFWSCKKLETINIPKSVVSMVSPFGGCIALHDIKVSEENTKFKFENDCLIEIDTKTLISGFCNAVIPQDGSVETIGMEAFAGLGNLENIIIPDAVKTIGSSAFFWCVSLSNVQLGKNLSTIEAKAFEECIILKSITIPKSVTTMGENVFAGCVALETVNCEATSIPEGWDESCFGDSKATIVLPEPEAPTDPTDPSEPTDPTDPEPQAQKGDVNGNEELDSMDYILLKRAYFGTYKLEDISVGDLNDNGIIDSMDYVFLKRAYFGTYVIK